MAKLVKDFVYDNTKSIKLNAVNFLEKAKEYLKEEYPKIYDERLEYDIDEYNPLFPDFTNIMKCFHIYDGPRYTQKEDSIENQNIYPYRATTYGTYFQYDNYDMTKSHLENMQNIYNPIPSKNVQMQEKNNKIKPEMNIYNLPKNTIKDGKKEISENYNIVVEPLKKDIIMPEEGSYEYYRNKVIAENIGVEMTEKELDKEARFLMVKSHREYKYEYRDNNRCIVDTTYLDDRPVELYGDRNEIKFIGYEYNDEDLTTDFGSGISDY